jgi:hypothetical protein
VKKYFLILFSLVVIKSSGQYNRNIAIFTGFGFYESFHAGINFPFGKSAEFFVIGGFDNNFFHEGKYIVTGGGINISFLNKIKSVSGDSKWIIQNKILYWSLDDRYYRWKVLSYTPGVHYRMNLSGNFNIDLGFGPVINFVVYNLRKTFEEVGWPHYIQLNPSVQLIYVFR